MSEPKLMTGLAHRHDDGPHTPCSVCGLGWDYIVEHMLGVGCSGVMQDELTEIECGYTDPPHIHSYPADWIFGGADGLHPGADPRFQPTTYTYYDADTTEITLTQTPLCDDQALDEFTQIAATFKDSNPRWLAAKRPGGKSEMLPWTYDKAEDLLTPRSA